VEEVEDEDKDVKESKMRTVFSRLNPAGFSLCLPRREIIACEE